MIVENIFTFMQKVILFSSYIKTKGSFEKPLSAEEEIKQITLARSGSFEARELLIKHNLRLVAHIVKKFKNSQEADDLISVGTIGLIKAVNSFDPTHGTRLSTYASRCIENEILMLLRNAKKQRAEISIFEPISSDTEGNELTVGDTLEDSGSIDVYDAVQSSTAIKKLTAIINKNLSKREAEIIKYRYGLFNAPLLTQREIAEKLGISRSYISRIEAKAIEIIRDHVKPEEFY